MGLFGNRKPPRIVVRQYGRDSILFAAVNPLMTAILVGMFGLKGPLRNDERLALAMEKDAVAMAKRGYRIAATHDYESPFFGIVYHKVTYELNAPQT